MLGNERARGEIDMERHQRIGELQRQMRQRMIAQRKCIDCQKPLEPDCKTQDCRVCAEKRKARRRKARARAKAAGLCMNCRRFPAAKGRVSCEICLERGRQLAQVRKGRFVKSAPPRRGKSLVPKACIECKRDRIISDEGRCTTCEYNHNLRLQWKEARHRL